MFKNQRYISKGVQSIVPLFLQIFMFHLIDEMKVEAKDGFQIFRLSERNRKQAIIHEQEEPQYRQEYLIDACGFSIVNVKVYVIDSRTYSTMLLAEEY